MYKSRSAFGERLAKWVECSPFTQEVEGWTSTGGTYPNDFSDPIDPVMSELEKCGIKVAVDDRSISERAMASA